MNRHLLLTGLVLLTMVSNAQKNKNEFDAAAKVVLLNNDTLYGTTIIDTSYKYNDFRGADLDRLFFFKETGKTEPKKFHPKELKGFQIKTADSLWSIFISSATLEKFKTDEGADFMGKSFLLKISEGEMSVYYNYHEDRHKFKDGSTFGKPNNVTKVLYKQGASKIYHSEIYEARESKLIKFVSDCPKLAGELKAVKCKGWDFEKIANYYNANCQQ
ncbi:MAG: hypothetical protein ABI741_15645 [Ferruginibacter sp.]